MAYLTPRRRLAGLLLLAALVGAGCNPLTGLLLLTGTEPRQPPELIQFAPGDKDKETKVVILAATPVESGTEFIRVDREISSILARHLQNGFKDNKEKIQVVSSRKVEKFKDDHPNWQSLGLVDIGKHFDADYVIYLEIQQLSLFEKGSSRMMYRGNANITVAVVDINKPDDDPIMKTFTGTYPSDSKGPVPIDDRNATEFRQAFLESIGRQLSWYFVSHPTRDLFISRE